LEVSKTLRANGTYGPSYQEAGNRGAADYLTVAKEDHAQRPLASEEKLGSAVAPALSEQADRTQMIMRAWVAADAASVRLIQEAHSIARTTSTVLIRGESGTGKDLLAWLLHALSSRSERPLVRIDCASLPSDLLEAELFGNSDAVFSSFNHVGRLESAAGGTLVLDEVSALSLPAQAKLLRLIEDRRFEHEGNTRSLGDTRIIALATQQLDQLVARRNFREDLYYRLNVIPMLIPPLRERTAEILPLATTFLNRAADVQRKSRMLLNPLALTALERYAFPGNVRELRQLMHQTVQNANASEVQITDLPPQVRESVTGARKMSLEDMERAYIGEILEHTRGRKTMAARILGISRKTLLEKRKRYGLD
jgi:DNA-binding NtrC family response regulator